MFGIVAEIAMIQSLLKDVSLKISVVHNVINQERTTSMVAPLDLSPIAWTSSTRIRLRELINFLFSFHFQVTESHFSGVQTMIPAFSSSLQEVKSESPVHSAT